MKKVLNIIIGIGIYFIVAVVFMGYGHTETHPFLNNIIVLKFLEKSSAGDFADKGKFKNYEFNWNNTKQPLLTGPAITGDFYLWYSPSDEKDKTFDPMDWIKEGGWMEDEPWGPASLCHFYDPMGIDNGIKQLTDCSGAIERELRGVKEYMSRDALSWAVGDSRHAYSWTLGKGYILKALKETDPELRKRNMALAYRCLGQVLHLVCDMGCTPHVRNDSHPPKFSVVIGDPDPYEDLCKKIDVYTLWQENPANSYLKTQFNKFEKFEVLFDRLAKYTNSGFFSGQTITTDQYNPVIRPDNPYPNPIMTEKEYNKSDYTYYENYDGVSVKMCKDKVPVSFPMQLLLGRDSTRGLPYLDYECVKSMAAAIYPNIAEAGANVIRMFIPSLKMEILEAKLDSGGIIRGEVKYTLPSVDDEYFGVINSRDLYNGPVTLFINNTDTKIQAVAKKNLFEFRLDGKLTDLKKNDIAVVKLEFGGIVLKSDDRKVASTEPYIISITPSGAKPGDNVVIAGTNFGSDKSKGAVFFWDNVQATSISNWTETKIELKIPAGAKTGDVQVSYQDVKSNKYFYSILGLRIEPDPATGAPNEEVAFAAKANAALPASVKYVWAFGDNTSSVTKQNDGNVTHKYAAEGTYPVKVELYDNSNNGKIADAEAAAVIKKSGSGKSFSYNWNEKHTSWWPRFTVNFSLSGNVEGLNGNSVMEIGDNAYQDGLVNILFLKYGAFKITFNGAFTVSPMKIDTTYSDGSKDVFTFEGSPVMSWSTQSFVPYTFLASFSGTFENSNSFGSISIMGGINTKLERYDKNNKLTETTTGQSSWPLGLMRFDKQ